MDIKKLNKRADIDQNKKLTKKHLNFEKLINELNNKDLPTEIVNLINSDIEKLNSLSDSDKDLLKQLRKVQSSILKLIEKELKLVTKNHFRNRWLAIGMTAFGIPIGTAIGMSVGNMAFIGLGMTIGMIVGITIGMEMDKKAKESGMQLNIEIDY